MKKEQISGILFFQGKMYCFKESPPSIMKKNIFFFSASFETRKMIERPACYELVVDSRFFCRDKNNGKNQYPSLCCSLIFLFFRSFFLCFVLCSVQFISALPCSSSLSLSLSLSIFLFPSSSFLLPLLSLSPWPPLFL